MQSNTSSVEYLRFLGLAAIGASGVWLLFFAYSIHASLPFNPIDLPMEKELALRIFAPQGWKFFTRNPREESISTYAKDKNGNWSPAMIGRNSSRITYFGLARTARAQGVEVGLIVASAKADQWVPCKERLDLCFEKLPTVRPAVNVTPGATVCGEIICVKQQPVPWAWGRSKDKITMPVKCLRVNVSCPQSYQG